MAKKKTNGSVKARLYDDYKNRIRPALFKQFGYKNIIHDTF